MRAIFATSIHGRCWKSAPAFRAEERTDRLREIDNVRAALDWCFSASGDTAIGVDLAAGYADWLRVDVATSMLDTTRGARQSLDLLTKALDTAEALDDLDAQARALVGIITHHSFSAGHDKTRTAAERLLQVAAHMGDAALGYIADRAHGLCTGYGRQAARGTRISAKIPERRSFADGSIGAGPGLCWCIVARQTRFCHARCVCRVSSARRNETLR